MHWIFTRVLVPGAIVATAGFGAVKLVQSAQTTEKATPAAIEPLVEVVAVDRSILPALVAGTGVVEPERKVSLSAEVSGRLTKLSDDVVVGGRVKQGDFIAKIDGRTYDLSVRQQNSQVARARSELELEKGRGAVAGREWELLGQEGKRSALALREPQREAAEVELQSAKAALDRAKFDRSRTRIVAPFNATITQESVEVGAYMAPGAQIATLVGTDAFRVRVSLAIEDLALIDIPGKHVAKGSKARVIQELGSRAIEREGTVVRLVGELDPDSRTAQVLVEVTDPLDPPEGELPLLPGAFVRVEIEGGEARPVSPVPRNALFDGDRVWVVADNGTISPHQLSIAWSDDDTVFATAGIEDGAQLMVTDLPTLAKGMRVRISEAKPEPEPAQAPAPELEAKLDAPSDAPKKDETDAG